MEPFFIRCETCQARLRVRDEQFLGQVQSCPKCGSMVHILAPAGWLVAGELTPTTETAEVAAAQTPTMVARVAGSMRDQASFWIAGTATAVVACGLLGFLALRGGDEAAMRPTQTPVAANSVTETSIDNELPIETLPTEEVAEREPAESEPIVAIPASAPTPAKIASVNKPESPVIAPPAIAREPIAASEKPRTLTLQPVHESAVATPATKTATAMPAYPPAVEVDPAPAEADRQATAATGRVTNFKDQLALPIDSIDLPKMPIGEFVNLVSTMAAVPIKLDPKVLGDVGMSSHSTVTVRGENTTAGQLLARVLKEHQLTCIERDGALNVVRAKR